MRGAIGAIALVALVTACGSTTGKPAVSVPIRHGLLLEVSPVHHARLSGDAQLEIVNARGRVLRQVADVDFDAFASVSPNGKLLAWTGSSGIVVERVDGLGQHVLAVGAQLRFAWSPDSRSLLATDNGALVSVSASTGVTRQLVARRQGLQLRPVAWLGSHHVLFDEFGVGPDGPKRLVIAAEPGARQRVIYDAVDRIHDAPIAYPSPNGKWVVNMTEATPPDPVFELVNVATGSRTVFPQVDGYETIAWAPDSTRYATGTPFGPIQLISLHGKTLETIHKDSYVPVAWTAHAIYFLPASPQSGGGEPDELLAIRAGHRTLQTLFTLRDEDILRIQPF